MVALRDMMSVTFSSGKRQHIRQPEEDQYFVVFPIQNSKVILTNNTFSDLSFQLHSKVQNALENSNVMGIAKPDVWACVLASKILEYIEGRSIEVSFVNPSHEGGVVIEFYLNNTYYLIEIYNDKDLVFLIKEKDNTRAYDTSEYDIYDLLEKSVYQNV